MSAVQRSTEWFAERAALSVTGSVAGMILGLSPYGGYQTALRNKVREVLSLPPDRPMNAAMQKGVDMEPAARAAYEADTGYLVTEVGLHVCEYAPWFGSSPDGIIHDSDMNRCLEIKVRNTPKPIADRPWELAQVQAHMHCTGLFVCDYYQWNESGGVLETIAFDDTWWPAHKDALEAFHMELQTILADEELLKPFREPLVERRTDPEFAQAEHEYAELKLMLEAATSAEKAARAKLLKLAGDKACEGELVKVTTYDKVGLIDNKKLHTACRKAGIDPEKFRGKPSTATRVTIK